jgi:hypothetical protein
MSQLYDLLTKAKHEDNVAMLKIINRFEPKIKKSLYQTSIQNREDLKQELIVKFIEVVQTFELNVQSTEEMK